MDNKQKLKKAEAWEEYYRNLYIKTCKKIYRDKSLKYQEDVVLYRNAVSIGKLLKNENTAREKEVEKQRKLIQSMVVSTGAPKVKKDGCSKGD